MKSAKVFFSTMILCAALLPMNASTQTNGEIRYQTNILEFWNGSSWTSTDVADTGVSCSSASPGEIRFNASPNPDRMEFCNGTNWRRMDGTVTVEACSSPGEIDFVTPINRMRYCNGGNWVFVVQYDFSAPVDCPAGYVGVPADGVYTFQSFCAMIFEAKAETNAGGSYDADGTGVVLANYKPASVVTNTPWRDISRNDARTECQSLGSGYDLMSNAQWQTIARNLEQQGANWTGGSVGNGCMFQGNNGETVCGFDGANPDVSAANARATFTLSTGAKIYDVAGNLWEWVRDPNFTAYGSSGYWPNITDSTHPTVGTLSDGIPRRAKAQFGPAGTYSTANNNSGLGRAQINGNFGSLRRGGGVGAVSADVGVFHTYNFDGAGTTAFDIGFRCVYEGGADPYASNVVLLIQPEADDTLILDYGPKGHNVMSIGSPALSTAVADPWSGNRKVILLDGNDDRLLIADSADWDLTGNFTMEFWVYFLANDASKVTTFVEHYQAGAQNYNFGIENSSNQGLYMNNSSGLAMNQGADNLAATGQWHHFVFQRSGTQFNVYQNGTSVLQTTNAAAFTLNAAWFSLLGTGVNGRGLNGYLGSARITNGVARFSTNFIPPADPYGPLTDACLGTPAIGTMCTGGALYLGQYQGAKYMVTPSGCSDSATPACAGGNDTLRKFWRGTGGTDADIPGVENIAAAATANSPYSRGHVNTPLIVAHASIAGDSAADFCNDMVFGGYDDWYLPSKSELSYLYCKSTGGTSGGRPQEDVNCAAVGGKTSDIGMFWDYYWSSTESTTTLAWDMDFSNGNQVADTKSFDKYVRCIRRYENSYPDYFDFIDVYSAALSTSYQVSAAVTGIVAPITASVTGGDAQVRKNGAGTWGASVSISPGDILNLRMTSSGSPSTAITATVTLGLATVNWQVSTGAGSEFNYFVLTSAATSSGNLGGLAGANAICLSDLQAGDWLGKSNVDLNSTSVKAFLCDGTTCQNTLASKTYAFATSGSPTTGGATFTTTAGALGPNDANNWSGATYFNSSVQYWSGRASTSATLWANTSDANNCSAWNSTATNGMRGTLNSVAATRWTNSSFACTSATRRLICLVDYTQGVDSNPDTFDFTDVTNATLSTQYTDNQIVLGFVGPQTASVSGGGAEIRANHSGSWVTSGLTIYPGDILNIRMTSSSSTVTAVTAVVTIGSLNVNWSITTIPDGCGSGTPAVGSQCAAGPIYVGQFDGGKYMITPGGCTDSATPTCAGGTDSVTKTWKGAGGTDVDIAGITNITTDATASSALEKGEYITPIITADASTTATSAADYCANMVYGGYSDWYLSSKSELSRIYCYANTASHNASYPNEDVNCASVGGKNAGLFGFAAGNYWSASEASSTNARAQSFSTGQQTSVSKGTAAYVRCVRRYGADSINNTLIAHWKMDETSGTTLVDAIGGKNGTMSGGLSGSNSVSGVVGKALNFDGTDDYADAGTAADFEGLPISVSVWFNLDTLPSVRGTFDRVFRKIHNAGCFIAWDISLNPGNDSFRWRVCNAGGSTFNLSANGALSAGTWYHAVMTIDAAGNGYSYVNGVQQTQTQTGLTMLDADGQLRIGANNPGQDSFDGKLDDIRIFRKALTPAEVVDLYAGNDTVSELICPTGYVAVTADNNYKTRDFCVAKYEMKNVSNAAKSQGGATAWVNVSRTTAQNECQAEGAGYDLISNDEWQNIARNIADVDWNWSTGIAYSGQLNRGHSDSAPASQIADSTSDASSCLNTGQACDLQIWNEQRRVWRMSNREYVWDLGGNAGEWTRTIPTYTGANANSSELAGTARDLYGNDQVCGTPNATPWCGFGFAFLPTAASIMRGPGLDWGTSSGIFTMADWLNPNNADWNAGFRCTYENQAPISCPAGYVPVPADGVHTTSDFCVAQYEMKNVGNVAVSQADITPWTSISKTNAISECQALGVGFDMITNAQWQTVAKNAELNAANWSTGIVGNECMFSGNAFGNMGSCDYNGMDPDYGAVRNSIASLTLSNGSVVWDMAGNVWEWVKDNDSTNYGADNYWSALTSAHPAWSLYGPTTDTYTGCTNNCGFGYANLNNPGDSVIRGSSYAETNRSGIYSFKTDFNASYTDATIGFRCVYNPK